MQPPGEIVGVLLRQFDVVGQHRYAQHAPTRGDHCIALDGRSRVKHHGVVSVLRQAGEGIALARGQRVAVCRHDKAQRRAAVPFQFDFVQPPMRAGLGGGHQHVDQIGLEPHHDRLGLGVAHAAVEFQRFGVALRINHQPGVQETGVRNAVFFHTANGGQDDLPHGARMHGRRDHYRR